MISKIQTARPLVCRWGLCWGVPAALPNSSVRLSVAEAPADCPDPGWLPQPGISVCLSVAGGPTAASLPSPGISVCLSVCRWHPRQSPSDRQTDDLAASPPWPGISVCLSLIPCQNSSDRQTDNLPGWLLLLPDLGYLSVCRSLEPPPGWEASLSVCLSLGPPPSLPRPLPRPAYLSVCLSVAGASAFWNYVSHLIRAQAVISACFGMLCISLKDFIGKATTWSKRNLLQTPTPRDIPQIQPTVNFLPRVIFVFQFCHN